MQIRSNRKEKLRGFFSKINKRVLGLAVLALVALGGGVRVYFALADAVATGGTVDVAKKSKTKLHFGNSSSTAYTYRYKVTYKSGEQKGTSYDAMCLEPEEPTPDGLTGQTVYDLGNISQDRQDKIKKILLVSPLGAAYGMGESYYNWSQWSSYGSAFALSHSLIGYVYDPNDLTGFDNPASDKAGWKAAWDERISEIEEIFASGAYDSVLNSVVLRRTKKKNDKQIVVWLEGVTPDEPVQFNVGIKKSSSKPDISGGSSAYKLTGAVFRICTLVGCRDKDGVVNEIVGEISVQGEDGKTNTLLLDEGIYYFMEITAPQGYKLPDYSGLSDDELADLTRITIFEGMTSDDGIIVDGTTVWYETEDDPIVGGIKIKKVDAETMGVEAIGGANLSGARIKIQNTSTLAYPSCNNGQAAGIAVVGSDGYAVCEGLVPGNYVAYEAEAGEGYLMNTTDSIRFTITAGNSEIIEASGAIKNQVMRGDVKFTKRAEDYRCKTDSSVECETLGGVPFVIENIDTGEKHVVVSDENGVVNTQAISHSSNTNGNDGLINNSYGAIVQAGVWFSGKVNETTTPDNSKGALVYGNYKITELRTSVNEPWKLLEGDSAITFSITRNGELVDLDSKGKYIDKLIDEPRLGTTATSESGEKKINVGEKVKIKDRISYEGLTAGKEYSVVVELVDKRNSSSSESYRTVGLYNEEGELASSVEIGGLIAGSNGRGTWDIELTFDSADYIGQELVVFEELWRGEVWIGEHKELGDGGQTVTVKKPEVLGTAATTNTADLNAKTVGAGKVKVYDIVTLRGLVKGKSYTVKTTAKLEDGTAIKLLDGENKVDYISNTISYSGNTGADYGYPVELYVDTATYGGKKIVFYQQLIGEEDYGTWPNSNSSSSEIAAETISVNNPGMGTVAFDGEGSAEGDKEIKISSGAKIRDKIHYTGLVNGTKYYISGKIVDKDGNEVAHSEGNTLVMKEATGSEGDWYLDFTVDTRRFNGQKLIVYEYLYADSAGSNMIVEHGQDALGRDEGEKNRQTVEVAKVSIETSAWVGSEGVKEAGVGKVTVSDKISYVGLTGGDRYKLSGELVLVEDGVEKEVISSKTETFTANVDAELRGSYTVTFDNINTSKYIGKKLVVKEVLYPDKSVVTEDDILAEHRELDNESQTVRVKTPTIETVATEDGTSGKEVDVRKDLSIYDRVRITGLVKGESYTVVGTLKNFADNTNVSASAFRKAGTSEAASPITVTNDDGSFEGLFEFVADTRALIGKEITVQEVILYTLDEEREVVRHTDKTDEQTVRVRTPEISTVTRDGISNNEGDKEIGVGETVIIDKVNYKNLRAGQTYKLVARMMDRETGEEVGCVGEKEFTGEAGEKSVEVEISCNTGGLIGKKLVAFEKLYIVDGDEEEEIAKHEELGDEEQFIDVSTPEIGTIATAETKAYDDEKIVDILEEAKIKDKIRYEGLVIGSRYRVEGVLYDKATGEKLVDSEGQEITAEYSWVADKESDEEGVEITFELDTTALPGRKLVAFEKLYLVVEDEEEEEEFEIAKHEKIDDEDQSVEVKPRVGTKVVDKIDNDQAVGVGKVEVIDTVSYEGLKQGKTYLLRGTMMDKKTGTALKQTLDLEGDCTEEEGARVEIELGEDKVKFCGEEVMSTTSENVEGYKLFTVGEGEYEDIDGEVKVEFMFETDQIQGKELVVFEKLYEIETRDAGEVGVIRTEHEDLEDEAQLVIVKTVGLGTRATDAEDEDKELAYGEEVEVKDLVEYRGLVKGGKYKLVGNLVDKENPTISVSYSEAEFIAEGENGEYIINFTLNTKDMSGKELVAFERLYYINDEEKEVEIGKHEDLEDQQQTVWVKVFTPNTGIFGSISDKGAVQKVSIVAVVIGALGGVYAVLNRKRKIRF